jgi:hypothetical protein
MRRALFTLFAALTPLAAGAQRGPLSDRQQLPSEVRREVAEKWNRPNALRSADRLEIEVGQEVTGDVAVQRGPLIISGHVIGSVLAINSDVLLRPTARIDGNLLVVGGEVDGRNSAFIGGSTRIYRQSLVYRTEGDQLIPSDSGMSDGLSWWQRIERRREGNWSEPLRVVQAGPYNRVEGLPDRARTRPSTGEPVGEAWTLRRRPSCARVPASAPSALTSATMCGPRFAFGHGAGIGIGGRLVSVVEPIETWSLTDLEVALASFVARRDYRDYFQRHGANLFVTLYGAGDLSLTGSYGDERWSSRDLKNPFTIFNSDRNWRDNPLVDDGPLSRRHRAAAVRHAHRSRGSVGRLVRERGARARKRDDHFGGADVGHDAASHSARTDIVHARFVRRPALQSARPRCAAEHARRPRRLAWRRSASARASIVGRRTGRSARASISEAREPEPDVGTCSGGPPVAGRPAECERIALAQIEYRGDLRLKFTGNWEGWPRRFHSAHGDVVWVLFADAGRGWRVGPPIGTLSYPSGDWPPLSTFRSDIGLGLDFAGIGVYAAKSVSTPAEPINFFVRLRHRF